MGVPMPFGDSWTSSSGIGSASSLGGGQSPWR